MRVPIRKAGKYTGQKPDPYITPEKYTELKNNLQKLKEIVRPRLAEEVRRLALDGDFSENAGYQIAKGRLRGINQRILDIEDHLKRAVLIDRQKSDTVQIGSQVAVLVDGEEKTFLILGSSETNPKENIISHNSPLGSALLGKKIGDKIKIGAAKKKREYEIIKID